MGRLKFLLRPGWLVLAALVLAFAFLCFYILAPWQLGKNTSTEHRNQLIADSMEAPVVPITDITSGGTVATDDEWRSVTATGEYVQDADVLVRLRSIDGRPAYEVLTPFALDSGDAVLVNRGYVRPEEGTAAPPVEAPPSGEQTLLGRIRLAEPVVPGREPLVEDGVPQVYTIAPGPIGEIVGMPLLDGYVQLEADQAGGLGLIPLPQLDAGPYLSYGLQWVAFGIMAPLGLAYFVRAELRERRKSRARAAGEAPAPVEPVSPEPVAPEPRTPARTDADSDTPEVYMGDIAIPTGPFRRRRRSAQRDRSLPEDAPTENTSHDSAKLADRYGRR
ncbi:SURF1 family protein [Rhodococcus rhodnii]|uniref:SURF1-like protein n=1 Tax=Rhodococcus rhodnii TaxID=38312 RepID=A0A6P2CLR1_9NOCA|nr:SURF1 family protein [Rhodococcus rhodnii]TXG92781.1 SURF1 family protein [Rhodococcus rhodnii]